MTKVRSWRGSDIHRFGQCSGTVMSRTSFVPSCDSANDLAHDSSGWLSVVNGVIKSTKLHEFESASSSRTSTNFALLSQAKCSNLSINLPPVTTWAATSSWFKLSGSVCNTNDAADTRTRTCSAHAGVPPVPLELQWHLKSSTHLIMTSFYELFLFRFFLDREGLFLFLGF